MSVLWGLSSNAAATLLKTSVGADVVDEGWHPLSANDANSAENSAVRVRMCGRDTIDLHEGIGVNFAREPPLGEPSVAHQLWLNHSIGVIAGKARRQQ
jgi:hypothetical protein